MEKSYDRQSYFINMAVRPLKLPWLERTFLEGLLGLMRIAPVGESLVNSEHELTFDRSGAQDLRGSSAARRMTTHL